MACFALRCACARARLIVCARTHTGVWGVCVHACVRVRERALAYVCERDV